MQIVPEPKLRHADCQKDAGSIAGIIFSLIGGIIGGLVLWFVLAGIDFVMSIVFGLFIDPDLEPTRAKVTEVCDDIWATYDPAEKERRRIEKNRQEQLEAQKRAEEAREDAEKARKRAETELWILQKKREGYTYQPDGHGGYKFGPQPGGSSSGDAGAFGLPSELGPSRRPSFSSGIDTTYPSDPESPPDPSSIW